MISSDMKKETSISVFISIIASFYKVIPKRFERLTHALEGRCSIQLSYGTILICGAKVRFFTKIQNEWSTFFD